MVSFKARMEISDDLQQTLLTPEGIKIKDGAVTQSDFISRDTDTFFCPFCLYEGKLNEFLIVTKTGFSKHAKCPACEKGMMLKTVTAKMTVEQYAEFVAGYIKFGFWRMVNSQKFMDRLKELGIASRFWTSYRNAKQKMGIVTGEYE